jgi:hypothetical protein
LIDYPLPIPNPCRQSPWMCLQIPVFQRFRRFICTWRRKPPFTSTSWGEVGLLCFWKSARGAGPLLPCHMFVLPLELLHLWFGVTGQIWESDALSFFHLHEPLYDEASRFFTYSHGRMARGDHGLPKVSLGLAMPYPTTHCGRATVSGLAHSQGVQPAAVFYPLEHPALYAFAFRSDRRVPRSGRP